MSSEQVTTQAVGLVRVPDFVRRAGAACLAAGVLGAASGVFLAVYPAQVADDRFSYPLTSTGFVVIQVWFFVQHLGLLAGIVACSRTQALGPGRAGRWGVWAAAAGMGLLAVTELLAIRAKEVTYPGPGTGLLDVLYGVSSLLAGVGLIVAGVAVLRARRWTGWRGWIVLVAGIWVFVPMMPALVGPFLLARLAITCWMVLFAGLGYALMRERSR